METEKKEWNLFRTNNGECISEIHVIILTEILNGNELAMFAQFLSKNEHKLNTYWNSYDTGKKMIWCYKNDIKELVKADAILEKNKEEWEKVLKILKMQ